MTVLRRVSIYKKCSFCIPDKENRLSASNENEIEEDIIANELKHLTCTPAGVKIKSNIHLRSKVKAEFPEGRFFGFGRHRDGAEISEYFSISKYWFFRISRLREFILKMLRFCKK